MKYKIEINTQTGNIDLYKIVPVYNHMDTQHKEHIGWILDSHQKSILKIIEALDCEETLYEIFVGMYHTEIEVLRVAENKDMRIAHHVCWLDGKDKQVILGAIDYVTTDEVRDLIDLEADFVDNELNRALNK